MQKMASQKKAVHVKSVHKVQCAVQWLRLTLPIFQCRGRGFNHWLGLIPDWKTKMPPAAWSSQMEK